LFARGLFSPSYDCGHSPNFVRCYGGGGEVGEVVVGVGEVCYKKVEEIKLRRAGEERARREIAAGAEVGGASVPSSTATPATSRTRRDPAEFV